MNLRRSTLPILILAAAAATATACASAQKTAAGSGTPVAPNPAATTAPATPATATSSVPGAATSSAPVAGKTTAKGTTTAGDPQASSDSYAWAHPCGPDQVSVKVGPGPDGSGPDIRIVTVTNTSGKACGLAYYPTVTIADSASVGGNSYPTKFVQPKPPEGLGGMPYIPIYAGQSQYAAISLNPKHATTGVSTAYNEIEVMASDFLPHAATVDFPLKGADGKNPPVLSPIIGLFERTTAESLRGLSGR